ncbi:MAG: copper-binding protein [Phycisphaeraceae bacterium]|nr:copper-binding protein [Phycisphaeraceae bacterium]QYK47312.1 MAG: copper-binding protein [Phycisphaeraceae bacterium]
MKTALKAVALATASFLLCSACDRAADVKPGAANGAQDPAPITHTYQTRGIIESLPDRSKPTAELQIRHEAINDFVDGAGKLIGMNAMIMPFPDLAQGVTLEGLAVGDKIEFSFTNTWSGAETSRRPRWVIDSISKLPPETELTFGKKSTPRESEAEPADAPTTESP